MHAPCRDPPISCCCSTPDLWPEFMKWIERECCCWGFSGLKESVLVGLSFWELLSLCFLSPQTRDRWVLFMEVSGVLSSGPLQWCWARWFQYGLPPPLKPHLPCRDPWLEVLLMQEILENVGRCIPSYMALHLIQGNTLVKPEDLFSLALAPELHLLSQGLEGLQISLRKSLVHEGKLHLFGHVDTSQQHSSRTTEPHLLTMSFQWLRDAFIGKQRVNPQSLQAPIGIVLNLGSPAQKASPHQAMALISMMDICPALI